MIPTCWNCDCELHWQNDYDLTDITLDPDDEGGLCTIWTCPKCGGEYEAYFRDTTKNGKDRIELDTKKIDIKDLISLQKEVYYLEQSWDGMRFVKTNAVTLDDILNAPEAKCSCCNGATSQSD